APRPPTGAGCWHGRAGARRRLARASRAAAGGGRPRRARRPSPACGGGPCCGGARSFARAVLLVAAGTVADLASPGSRRIFWRLYPYPMSVFFAVWLVIVCTGCVNWDDETRLMTENLFFITLSTFVARSVPTTSVWSDFLLSSIWSALLWFIGGRFPECSVVGMQQLPFLTFWVWATGLHSCFVAQFCVSGCLRICLDPRFGASRQFQVVYLVGTILGLITLLEWQSVSHYHKVQKLLSVSTDGHLVVDKTTRVIASVSSEMTLVLGQALIGAQFDLFSHHSDRAQIEQCFGLSVGEPSEAFLATLWYRQSPKATPTREFEARIIPFEVTGPHLHFCIQIVGEMRTYPVDGGSVHQPRPGPCSSAEIVQGAESHQQNDDDTCSFTLSSNRASLPPWAQGPRLQKEDDSDSLTVSSLSGVRPPPRWPPEGPSQVLLWQQGDACADPAAPKPGDPLDPRAVLPQFRPRPAAALAAPIAEALLHHNFLLPGSACCPWHQ
ncbi:unnamed protein product, partial [Prorocentrum cordatum]